MLYSANYPEKEVVKCDSDDSDRDKMENEKPMKKK